VERLARGASGKWAISKVKGRPARGASGKIKGGIYMIRHGKTDSNAGGKGTPKLPPTPARHSPAPKFK